MTTKIKSGTRLRRRRTNILREVSGFTTKPSTSAASDGIRRARLIDPFGIYPETRVRVDQILKTYAPA